MESEKFVDCRPAPEIVPICEAIGLHAWQLIDLRTENPILDNYVISKEGIRGQLQVLVENQIISAQEADRVRNDISANPDQYPGLADDDDVVLSLLFEKGAMTTESIDDFKIEVVPLGLIKKRGHFTFKGDLVLEAFCTKKELIGTINLIVRDLNLSPDHAARLYHKAVTEIGDLPKTTEDLVKELIPKQNVLWIRTNNRPILNKAGVAYGLLVLEDGTTSPITSMDEAYTVLNALREEGMITQDTFARVVGEVEASGMERNMLPVIEKIVGLETPKQAYESWSQFEICDCPIKWITRHGHLPRYDEPNKSREIIYLAELIETVEKTMLYTPMTVEHAISIIQHGYREGLPFTKEELREAYMAARQPFPEELKRVLKGVLGIFNRFLRNSQQQ